MAQQAAKKKQAEQKTAERAKKKGDAITHVPQSNARSRRSSKKHRRGRSW